MNKLFENFHFADPYWALLILLLPLLPWIKRKYISRKTTLLFPTVSTQISAGTPISKRWLWIPYFLRNVSILLAITAMCRPQTDLSTSSVLSSGVDIVLVTDLSESMLALDMSDSTTKKVTRLDAVKEVLGDFIYKRKHDRIGLVAFTDVPYLASPLTLDKEHLQKNIDRLKVGLTDEISTNIGGSLAEGINRLRNLDSKSKIIVLLTDGKDSKEPKHSPLTYAIGAKADGIKIYTIAVGSDEKTDTYFLNKDGDLALQPNGEPALWFEKVVSLVDKEILSKISSITDAQFFEAKDKTSLQMIYNEIDRLEKTDVEMQVNALFEDLYQWPLIAALLLLFCEFILSRTRYLKIP
jgi:Ca-activated chloride channel family protein